MARALTLTEALNRYPHRFTMEHVPQWALQKCGNGYHYAPQYRTDAEWYGSTTFPGERHLTPRCKWCESNNQSWPLGQFLEQPYRSA